MRRTNYFENKRRLSIIIPCFNERATIALLLDRVAACPHEPKDIVVVDDGSSDGTRELLEDLLKTRDFRLFSHARNQGKGAAIRTGIAEALGDIVIVQDADLEYDPQEIPKVIAPILDGRAAVVYGSRFIGGEAHRVLYFCGLAACDAHKLAFGFRNGAFVAELGSANGRLIRDGEVPAAHALRCSKPCMGLLAGAARKPRADLTARPASICTPWFWTGRLLFAINQTQRDGEQPSMRA